MLARTWEAGLVGALLAASGADASRPEDLPQGVGLIDGRYQLTETQAQQILEMRRSFFLSFGSCSFLEPVKELVEQGWLETAVSEVLVG